MMIYELMTTDGYRLGLFSTEDSARRMAGYLPKGRYAIREWIDTPGFLEYDPDKNKLYVFNN